MAVSIWGGILHGAYLTLIALAGFLLISWLGLKVLDRLIPQVKFEEELAKGNIAVGILMGFIVVAIGLIIVLGLSAGLGIVG